MAWFAAIPLIMQGIGMAQGAQAGQRDKALLKQQGKVASRGSVADAEAMLRDYRQLIGTQAATIAQGGGAYGGSAVKLMEQSETLANLDRLKTLYSGELERGGLVAQGSAVGRRSQMLAGTQLLTTGSRLFNQSKAIPQGY